MNMQLDPPKPKFLTPPLQAMVNNKHGCLLQSFSTTPTSTLQLRPAPLKLNMDILHLS